LNLNAVYKKAMTYDNYVTILNEYQSLHQLHYNKFIVPEDQNKIIQHYRPLKILVITEPWCGDSLALIPVLRKIAETNGSWDIKLLLRDANSDLMHQFLTNGARAIPIFLFLDDTFNLLFRWGPRPVVAQKIFEDHRILINQGKIEKTDVIKKIRLYYTKDRGLTTYVELSHIFLIHKL
jgi:hypothetical protein